MDKPTSLTEAIIYLREHPRVTVRGPDLPLKGVAVTRDEEFVKYTHGGFWFRIPGQDPHFMPVACGLTQAESGLTFDCLGFTLTKFGIPIRVNYKEDFDGQA